MKRSFIAAACLAALAYSGPVRARTLDVAFTYRMGAGFPGDVNRTHPASIVPGLINATTPVRLYGDPVLVATDGTYRGFTTTDTTDGTACAGILVRPYPTQQQSGGMSSALGAATPPINGAGGTVDVIDSGFVMVRCNNFAATPPKKGGAVYVWVVASTGAHVLGGLESVEDATPANTTLLSNATFNGAPDANGIVELRVWPAK